MAIGLSLNDEQANNVRKSCALPSGHCGKFRGRRNSVDHIADVPDEIMDAIRLGRLTALRKPNGGVRGIVVGDIVRRLVGRTMAQQFSKRVEVATSPFQYALSTRAGAECVTHVLQTLTDLDERATILSVDGIGAYDLISRHAMLSGLRDMEDGAELLPFVSSLYGRPSTYLWEDELGVVHDIQQGEGGEQGDALMPMLFSLGQHRALVASAEQLQENEKLFAFLDDIYVVCDPDRVENVHQLLQRELWVHARISLHLGKTQVWNRSGECPPACEEMQRAAVQVDPDVRVWNGDVSRPGSEQGLKILGTPVGQPEYVTTKLDQLIEKHRVLLERIPAVNDLQSSWLFLTFCAATRANYTLRNVQPELALWFAVQHDANVWQCFCNLLGVNPDQIPANSVQTASLPLRLGGLGLRSAERTLPAAHWASWADSLAMINARHPAIAGSIVKASETNVEVPFVREVQRCVDTLVEADFSVPSWEELADGVRPPPSHDEEEPNQSKHGWQKVAGHSLDDRKLHVVTPTLSACEQALLRSQAGQLAAVLPFVCFPTSRLTRLDPPVFRTLLLRRLRLHRPLTVRACRCGLFLDAFGHHRSACAVSGVLKVVEPPVFAVEAGARPPVNLLARDLDLGVVDRLDARRLEMC